MHATFLSNNKCNVYPDENTFAVRFSASIPETRDVSS